MDETTALGRAKETAARKPLATAGVAVAIATALQQGIPLLLDQFSEAHESHIETLAAELVKCQEDRQRTLERLMECAGVNVSDGAYLDEGGTFPSDVWEGKSWPLGGGR